MSNNSRNKTAEKTIKQKLKQTHLRSYSVIGSEINDHGWWVYFTRMRDGATYLYKAMVYASGAILSAGNIRCVTDPDELARFKMYAPKAGTIDALRPTEAERKRRKK